MKKVRFSQLVAKCGHPESHLVLTAPKKDRTLQAAIKASRVLTVMQSPTGTKADWAEVGFHPATGRQYLLFPKSLAAHTGKAVIGIKYDLLKEPETSPTPKTKPAKKAPARKPAKKAAPSKPPPPPKEKKTKDTPEVAALKRQIKRAMQALEKGHQVAAFNLLQKIVDD